MADTNDRTQNVTLFDNAKSKNVSVITDGSLERLAVDADVDVDLDQPEFVEGGQRRVVTTDDIVRQLLTDMLRELKKMNLQLASMNDVVVRDTEVRFNA